jgi:hypothetical protein
MYDIKLTLSEQNKLVGTLKYIEYAQSMLPNFLCLKDEPDNYWNRLEDICSELEMLLKNNS